MSAKKVGHYIGKDEKPEDVLPPRYEVHAPMTPHPVEVALKNFLMQWCMVTIKLVFVVLIVLSYVFTAFNLVVSIVGAFVVAVSDKAKLVDDWWVYPLSFIMGVGVCILLDRARRWIWVPFREWLSENDYI